MEDLDILDKIKRLGCNDEKKCALAYQVFLDLRTNKLDDLKYDYLDNEDLIYLSAREGSEAVASIYIPHAVFDEIDVTKILDYQTAFCQDSQDDKCIFIAICDPSSTILYYKITNKFIDDFRAAP